MRRNVGIGGLIAVLLLTGVLVGTSQGRSARIAGPETIDLVAGGVLREVSKGHHTYLSEKAVDAAGVRVGTIRWSCVGVGDWPCTVIISLKGRGYVVTSGLFRGFNGESLAVTGGTGDFANVRGTVTLSVIDGFAYTLELIP